MKSWVWILPLLVTVLAACGGEEGDKTETVYVRTGEHEALLIEIDSLKQLAKKDMQDNPRELNRGLHREFVKKMEYFGRNYTGDTIAPYMLLKAARGYEEVLNEKDNAIDLYTVIYNNYPDFPDRPMMLFYQGSAYQDIRDTTLAVQRLQFFMKTYPEHEFADDAQALIDYMRMDEEQLNNFFKEKAQAH